MAYSISSTDNLCYPGTTILVNKLGIIHQRLLDEAEAAATALRTIEITEAYAHEPLTFDFYCGIHRKLFGDLYDWAGTLRQIDLSKKGTQFYPADQLLPLGKAKFRYLQSKNEFRGMNRDTFIDEITDFYSEMNLLHPFREGNGRTQRLFFTLLIQEAGYRIDFSECSTDELMIATIYAAHGVSSELHSFFDKYIKTP